MGLISGSGIAEGARDVSSTTSAADLNRRRRTRTTRLVDSRDRSRTCRPTDSLSRADVPLPERRSEPDSRARATYRRRQFRASY